MLLMYLYGEGLVSCKNLFPIQLHNLLNSEVLAFPRFDLQFRLAVDTSSRGIGYMLYQLHNENGKDVPQVVRFGSKSLSG
jgi:hypothetical protein